MQASQELFIQSRAGSIEASSLEDITLRAKNVSLEHKYENFQLCIDIK